MDNNTDILHEAKKLRLLAAALELQHFTSTAANVVPIPGTERFVVIGTPAEAMKLLLASATPAVHTNIAEDVAHLFSACGFEVRSTDPAEKHPLAVCGSLDAAGLVVETLMVGQNDPDAVPVEFVALLPGVTYMDPPDGGSVSVLEQFRRMAQDAQRYRLLRDAEKVPAAVWHALEQGKGLDDAMDCFTAIMSPIPFCEPCKAGRFAECVEVFPCTLPPAPATVEQDHSEGGHHD